MFSENASNFWGVVGGIAGVLALVLAIPKIQKRLERPGVKKAVKVEFEFYGLYSEGVLLHFDPNQNLAYYKDENLIAYSYPKMSVSVRSSSVDSWIRVAPYLWVEILEVIELHDSQLYVDMRDGRGGGGMPRYMQAVFLSNLSGKYKAPYLGEDFASYTYMQGANDLPNSRNLLDSFTLEPGEIEIFDVDFTIEPGYIYNFRVGIEYIFEEKRNLVWSGVHKIAIPKQAELWTVRGIRRYSDEWEGGDYPDNYETIGLKCLDKQDYQEPKFSRDLALKLYKFSQNIQFRLGDNPN